MWRFLLAAFLTQLRRLLVGLGLILLLLYLITKLPIRHKRMGAVKPMPCLALPIPLEPRFTNAACLLMRPYRDSDGFYPDTFLEDFKRTRSGDFPLPSSATPIFPVFGAI